MKVGVDTIEIERLNSDKNFLEKIFLPSEIDYFNKFEFPLEHIAGFFAAKEAVFKALDLPILHHKEIEILHNKNGKPYVVFHGETKKHFEKCFSTVDLTISHAKTIATAVCVAN